MQFSAFFAVFPLRSLRLTCRVNALAPKRNEQSPLGGTKT